MHLMHRRQRLGGQAELGHGAAAVLGDSGEIVARGKAAIERGENAGADAAATGEKPMPDTGLLG